MLVVHPPVPRSGSSRSAESASRSCRPLCMKQLRCSGAVGRGRLGSNISELRAVVLARSQDAAKPQTKTLGEPCETVIEEVISPVIEVPLWGYALLHAGQISRLSTRRWYARRFEDCEEHAAEDQQKSSTSNHTKGHSSRPQPSQERGGHSSEAAAAVEEEGSCCRIIHSPPLAAAGYTHGIPRTGSSERSRRRE